MAVVTGDYLAAVLTNFRALFNEQFLAFTNDPDIGPLRSLLAMEVPSTTLQETYNWLGTVPVMTEWLAERKLAGLSSHNFTLTNRHWANGLEVDRDAMEDDKLGMFRPKIAQLAQEAARFPTQKIIEAFADNAVSYDGQNLFDTDHKDPGATFQTNQANTLTGTGTTLTTLQTDLNAALTAMRRFKDGEGRPMNIRATHILAPPELDVPFRQLLNGAFYPTVATGAAAIAPNVFMNSLKLITSAYLTDADDWFLLALDQPVKPIIFQNRQEPRFESQDTAASDIVFNKKVYAYGADSRFAVGPGMWQMAVRTTN